MVAKRARHISIVLSCFFVFLISLFITGSAFAESLSADSISFIYVEQTEASYGETQRIVVGFPAELSDSPIELVVQDSDSELESVLPLEKDADGTYVFSSAKLAAGTYSLLGFNLASGDRLDLSEDMKNSSFSVIGNEAALMDAEGGHASNGVSTSFTGSDGSSVSVLGDAVGTDGRTSRSKQYTFVLDAGHGGWDSGASANGLLEKDLTLKIARYCREELQKYFGANVLMTRDSDSSVTGVADTSQELLARSQIARDNNADLFVSFHINAGGGRGAEVWIPRDASWHQSFHELGESLAQKILDRLAAIGLVNRGSKSDYYDLNGNQLYYPDGSNADSLAVIRHCREYGIPAVLVEHGFIDQKNDAALLSDEAYLKKLGQADAEAIAEQFNLSKVAKPNASISEMRDGKVTLSWDAVPGAEKYAIALCNADGSFSTYTLDCKDTKYIVDNLKNGNSYSFLVQAYVSGSWTPFTSDDFTSCRLIPCPEVVARQSGDGEVTLTWNGVSGAECYAVAERMPDGSFRTFTLTESGTSYTVRDLANGVEHRFLVQAQFDGIWSSYADQYLVSATPEGTVKPSVKAEPSDGEVTLTWGRVPGAERYAVAVRTAAGYSTYTYDCESESYTVRGLRNGQSYRFLVQAWNGRSWSPFTEADLVECTTPGTPIMGDSRATVSKLIDCYVASGYQYPAVYAEKGAPEISDFCRLVFEEASFEGVRPEVLFAQAMYETGWLQFGGSVKAEQCNFGGLGAVNTTAAGTSFDDVQIGLRAQVQHLKAYASTDPLVLECVDSRFDLVQRGVAPTLEELNGRWAVPGEGYGQRIAQIVQKCIS